VAGEPRIELILTPDKYPTVAPFELLSAAGRGHVAIDHRFLRALLDDPQRLLPDLLRFLAEDRNRRRIDLEFDLLRIVRRLRAPETLPFLMALVALHYVDAPDILLETICDFREQAIEPLLKLYERFGPVGCSVVPFVLASLGVRDERIERLLREVKSADSEEGEFCLEIYHQRNSEAAAPEPFNIWEEYPEESAPLFDALPGEELLEFLSSPSVEHRAAAARWLADQVEPCQQTLARLVELGRRDPEAQVRGEAWRALAGRDEQIAEIAVELLARLDDTAVPVMEKTGLVVALADFADHPPVRRWILRFYENPETRARALEAMWRSQDASFVRYFPPHIEDPDTDVAAEAISGVGHFRITSALGRLERFFDHEELRPVALMAYTLAMPEKISPARVEAIFSKIEKLAGDFDPGEAEIVRGSLDTRLIRAGYPPHYQPPDELDEPEEEAPRPQFRGVGRNDPCPCGSGKKFKKCCGERK
jgi:hypothetical protein